MGKSRKPVDDWQDVPFEQEADAADDWQDVPMERPAPTTAVGDSVIRGAAQGASMGFADELTAGLGAAIDSTSAALGMRGDIDFPEAYDSYIDHIRAADKKAQEDHPIAYGGAELAGAAASSVLPGLKALNGAKLQTAVGGTAAKAMGPAGGTLVRAIGKEGLGKAALMGAQGGLTGAGMSEANPFESADQAAEFATDVGLGAATAGLTDLGLQGVGKGIKSAAKALPEALENFAERRAFKAAVGNQSKAYDEAVRQGTVNDIGRELLDDGIVTFGTTARKIADRAEKARKSTGQEIDQLLGQIDAENAAEKVTDPTSAFFRDIFSKTKEQELPFSVKGSDIAAKIRAYAEKVTSPANKAIVENLLRQAQEFEEMGQIGLKEAQRLKNLYKWDARDPAAMPIGKEATNALKMILGDELDEAVGRYAQAAKTRAVPEEQFAASLKTGSGRSVPGPTPEGPVLKTAEAADGFDGSKAKELYARLKAKYGTMASTAKNAEKNANRFEKNRSISLSDMLMGGFGGVATGNPVTGMAVGAVNNQLRKRGSSMAAVGADKLADVLRSAPEAFGRFAPQLQEAAKRGNHALAVTHFLLMQNDPEYRDTVEIQK